MFYLLKFCTDCVAVNTGLNVVCMQWDPTGALLAIAGAVRTEGAVTPPRKTDTPTSGQAGDEVKVEGGEDTQQVVRFYSPQGQVGTCFDTISQSGY